MMTLETIAVGQPREFPADDGSRIVTSIFKTPIPGPVLVRKANIEGDRQSNLAVHGGEHKAVLAYPADHYGWWRARLGRDLEPAQFGENLTIAGWDDRETCIGDVFRIGGVEIVAAQPRLPCAKLAFRMRDPLFGKVFNEARRWGVYFQVRAEGVISTGDRVVRIARHPAGVRVHDIARVHLFDRDDREAIERLLALDILVPKWRETFAERLRAR